MACLVGLAVVTFAGASEGLLLVLSPTFAGGFTLFVVLRLWPMADAVERRLAQDGAAEPAAAERHAPAGAGARAGHKPVTRRPIP